MPDTAEAGAAEAGRALLGVLSDDELARYGEIARDQAALELSRWWWQALLALAAAAAAAWAVHRLMLVPPAFDMWRMEFWRPIAVALGLALALGYWPYRRVKNWSLWRGHVKAVDAERQRRSREHC